MSDIFKAIVAIMQLILNLYCLYLFVACANKYLGA